IVTPTNLRMAGTGSSIVARRQQRTPDICVNVIPSDQPLAIQKRVDDDRQIATATADNKAMPTSRYWVGVWSITAKRRAALAVFSSSMASRRVPQSSEIRRISRRFRAALARRCFSQEWGASKRSSASISVLKLLVGFFDREPIAEPTAAINDKATAEPGVLSLTSDRRKSSISAKSGRRDTMRCCSDRTNDIARRYLEPSY